MKKTCPLQVTVAGGNKLVSQYMVYGFQWNIQVYQFRGDVMLRWYWEFNGYPHWEPLNGISKI